MRYLGCLAVALPLAALLTSCRTAADRPALSGEPAALSADAATGGGTVAPAITIRSITFRVDGTDLTLAEGAVLSAPPGSRVSVVSIQVFVGKFAADGGELCVDFAPTRASGEEIFAEHTGTHMVRAVPGPMTLPGPDGSWTIDEGWAGIAAVANHWPGVKTQDRVCAEGKCERDHRFVLPLRPR